MSYTVYDLDDDKFVESHARGIKEVLKDAQKQLKDLKELDEQLKSNNRKDVV